MTDRARHVYALLRTMLGWVPPVRSRSGAASGFVPSSRPCLACRTNGRTPACPHCHGTGLVPVKDLMDDPIRKPAQDSRRLHAGHGGADREHQRDLVRLRDNTIRRLEQQEQVRAGREAAVDSSTAVIDAHDRLYAHGSYAELDLALDWLRDVHPAGYLVAMGVAYQPFQEEPVEPSRGVVVAVCELLASRMPATIRVPGFVTVWTAEEVRRRADVLAEQATWAGRRQPAARAQRDAIIRGLAAEGLAAGKIGERLNVSRWTVQRVLAVGATGANGGEVAA